jgi:1,4-alpha-glucan branching enzyme
MRLFLRFIFICVLLSVSAAVTGQVVTTNPVAVTSNSTGITITFHADGGNKGLMGSPSTTGIYAHTGVITDKSNGAWKYAPTWGDNAEKYKLKYVSANTWTLTIPDVRSYYGITDTSETVEKLCFVFRNANNTKEGKTASGGDIFVPIYPEGFPSASAAADYPGSTPKMGTTVNPDGSVTFCLGAPGKSSALIVGSWNKYALDAKQLMNYQDHNGVRYFWTTLPDLADAKDHIYYYIVDGCTYVGDPYANLVLDPWNDQYIPSSVFPNLPAYPSDHITGVPVALFNSAANDYAWNITDFKGAAQSDLIIYELLVRDFTGTENKANGTGTIKAILAEDSDGKNKLDYIKGLGVNAVELLPIMEFNGNNSWGYNTNFYMAPDKAYGTPDDYRRFVDECHARGLAVILDIVFNQSDGLHPWYNMYTQTNTPFYNGSAPHSYSVLNDWNQDFSLVQQQWHDALTYWLTVYNVDGFRFDLVKGLGNNDSYGSKYDAATNTWSSVTETNTNRFNATRVARMKQLHAHIKSINPDAYFINENLAGAQEENDMAADGEINWANINNAACQYAMGYSDGASLDRFYAPMDGNRLWGSTVSYAESHDEERVAYKVKQYGVAGVKGNSVNTMRRLGSLAAQMILTPGSHMIWQFEELGDDQTTKNTDGSNNTSPKKVMWNYLKDSNRMGLYDTYAKLNDIRTSNPELFRDGVSTAVNLSGWAGRSIALCDGSKELYLVVNPATSTATVSYPKNPKTNSAVNLSESKYTLLACSHEVTPSLETSGVRLPAGAFAVYGASVTSGIDDVITDGTSAIVPEVIVENNQIKVLTPCTTVTLHSVTGISLPVESVLAPGIYIVTVDSVPVKVAVR